MPAPTPNTQKAPTPSPTTGGPPLHAAWTCRTPTPEPSRLTHYEAPNVDLPDRPLRGRLDLPGTG
ncbi:hypothetical protein GCM10023088_42340 [Actinomadura verrucosospora]